VLEELTFPQFLEWFAYDALEPIGGRRGDWQAASVCSAIANTAAARSGSKKRFLTRDFLLEFGADKPTPAPSRQTWQEQKMIAMMFAAASHEKRKK